MPKYQQKLHQPNQKLDINLSTLSSCRLALKLCPLAKTPPHTLDPIDCTTTPFALRGSSY